MSVSLLHSLLPFLIVAPTDAFMTFCNLFAGNVSLSGNSACKWFINIDAPEVNSFRARFVIRTLLPHHKNIHCLVFYCTELIDSM